MMIMQTFAQRSQQHVTCSRHPALGITEPKAKLRKELCNS